MNECEKCKHEPHEGRECGAPITRTFRDDAGYGGIKPTGRTKTILEDLCSCGWQHRSKSG